MLASSYVLLWAEESAHRSTVLHLVLLAVGVVILDVGAQMTQVANQTRIFGLVPSARSRLNTVYMTVYFTGAAAGSALATRRVGALEVERRVRAGARVDRAGGTVACNGASRRRGPLQGDARRCLDGSLSKDALGLITVYEEKVSPSGGEFHPSGL